MIRRTIDILFASLWLGATAPIMLVIALLIKLDSAGPILYMPQVVGYRGKAFALWRFRTMCPVAPTAGTGLNLTRVGRFIRNYSLDHLPMIINLLMGDLTLIGPRPMEVAVVDLREPIWQQYCQLKPGLFNYAILALGKWWAPSRERNPALNQELELAYQQQRSALVDLRLFIQYFYALFASRGNIKMRGNPAPEAESRLADHEPSLPNKELS